MFSIMVRLPAFYVMGTLWVFSIALLSFVVINQWYPENIRHQALQSEVSTIREDIIHIIRLNEFAKDYTELKQDLKSYKARLETPVSQSDLAENLYKIASKNKITVLSESNKRKSKDTIEITMKSLLVEGKYRNIRKYIYDLNRLKSMAFINRVEIKNKKKSHKVKASVQFVIYSVSK